MSCESTVTILHLSSIQLQYHFLYYNQQIDKDYIF